MTHKAIFENLLLSEEAKVQLEEAFTVAVEAKAAILEAEYKEKEEELQETVIAQVQDMVAEALSEELDVLGEELAHARQLDVEYAEKLELFKESYEAAQADVIRVMVAESVAEEVAELMEDVEFAKQNAFGMQIYEAFRDSFDANFAGADIDVASKLRETEVQLEAYQRKEAVEKLLEGIGGKERAVFETLLEGVAIERLEERFSSVKPLVLREGAAPVITEGDAPVITEGDAPVITEGQIVVEEGAVQSELAAAFSKAIGLAKRK